MKADVKYLRELVRLQKKVTGGTKMKRADVENMAKLLMKNNNIKGDYRELSPMLTELYEFMAANEDIGVDALCSRLGAVVSVLILFKPELSNKRDSFLSIMSTTETTRTWRY